MNLVTLMDEYDNLSLERKSEALRKLLEELIREPDRYEFLIFKVFAMASDFEDGDYFGTEGLEV